MLVKDMMRFNSGKGLCTMDNRKKTMHPLADFKGEVEELKKQYLAFLDSLSSNLAESGKNQFFERAKNRGSGPCITFYTPFWYADVFGERDRETIKQIAMGSFYLYHFVTLKDDVLDQQGINANEYLLLSDVVLEKSLEIYSQFASRRKLTFHFNKLMHQWNHAEAYLNRHQGRMVPYEAEDFQMMGEKAAALKLCLPAFNGIRQQREPHFSGYIDKAVDAAVIGFQFMDDLLDWREDLENDFYTYPLWIALSSRQEEVRGDHRDIQYGVSEELYLSGIAEHILEKSNEYLALSKDLFTDLHGKYWASFLDSTMRQNSALLEAMQSKKQILRYKKPVLHDLLAELERLIKITLQPT